MWPAAEKQARVSLVGGERVLVISLTDLMKMGYMRCEAWRAVLAACHCRKTEWWYPACSRSNGSAGAAIALIAGNQETEADTDSQIKTEIEIESTWTATNSKCSNVEWKREEQINDINQG